MITRWIAGGGAALVCSAPVLAAEEHGGGASNPFAGDIGTALWTFIVFGLVVFVLGKFVWPQILRALQQREDYIYQSLEQAKQEREAAEAAHREYVEKLQSARVEASAVVEEGRRDAEVLRRKLEEQAKANADAILERAKREIALATDNAVKELYTLSATLATEVAGRVIEKEIDAGTHERLIAESIEEIARLQRN